MKLALCMVLAFAGPAPAGSRVDELRPMFLAAEHDSDQLADLILVASEILPKLSEEEAKLLADTLEPFCRRAFFTPERFEGMDRLGLELHRIAKGEIPGRIARDYGIGAGLFPYLNDPYEERSLRIGQRLKVLDLSRAELEVRVDKSSFRVSVWQNLPLGRSILIAHIQAGLGADATPTPVGNTRVIERVLDPQWTHPVTKEVFPHGHPENVLGGYWIELSHEGIGKRGIGFHGFTGDLPRNWLERGASNGCVRLLQPDVHRLYHIALEGTRVVIQP